jgi:hypothetical protein
MTETGRSVPTSRVAVASGMVAAQVGCSPDVALLLMSERAEASNRTLEEIAVAVVEHETRFD